MLALTLLPLHCLFLCTYMIAPSAVYPLLLDCSDVNMPLFVSSKLIIRGHTNAWL